MGRVEQGSARQPSAGPGIQRHHKQLTNSAKPGYKVILEEVTQARKALKLEDYHNLEPPLGYKFVPAGDPTLTTKCKEFARLDGRTVYKVIIKTTDSKRTELSKQVHRVGFHFPNDIVQRALTSLGIDIDQEDEVLRTHDLWPKEEVRRKGLRNAKRSGKVDPKDLNLLTMSQEEVDAQAKAAILDMFPAIPMDNLYQIVLHAFELGTQRVGVQLNDLSLPRRVQLAVVAHIRHVYTDYDALLHSHSWTEARNRVGEKTLEVLAKWRGDKDDDNEVLEDILREVLVISDDEEEPPNAVTDNNSASKTKSRMDQPLRSLPTMSSETYQLLPGQGRSNKLEAQKQKWRGARERRKEPAPPMQALGGCLYYMPRSDRDSHTNIDPHLYEKRLRILETHPRHVVDNQQFGKSSQDRMSTHYLQPEPQQVLSREYQNSSHSQISKPSTGNQFIHPSSQHNSGMTARSGNIISTPPRARLTSQQSKLVIPPNEVILPSIETPKADRASVSAFAHGAIHIDSPPSEKRPDFRFLRQEPIDSSPAKRKRERSPFGQSINFQELAYRPVQESRQYHTTEREAHDHNRSQSSKLVYLPLDSEKTIQPAYQIGRDQNQHSRYQTGNQVYHDTASRIANVRTVSDHGITYQYLPLSPVEQTQNVGKIPEFPSNASRTLRPLDNYRDSQPERHPFANNQPLPQGMIALDSPRLRSEQRPINEVDLRQRNMEAHSYNDVYSRPPQHETTPYDPQDRQTRHSQYRTSPRSNYEHRRYG